MGARAVEVQKQSELSFEPDFVLNGSQMPSGSE